ncbi:LacI family DNA-binding transcriptional regulator [Alteromonas halophila]|uniref:LacI family transcriptional regulator n=1 Tax=Alteromonas halophila TaxID=516698 RepID=A0A918JHA6_9ALTE|nr:LacI family DNA-binding transcriptional regulator [Alteromonas halophila]GGW81439.1 LacI family transcriptional regulator [Alteromonas halophila]
MPATIKSVAEQAGVSIKTVSRVINNEGTVKPDTLKKVQDAIAALDYRPNKAARDLAGRENFVLSYVYDNPNAYYVIDMQQGILQECRHNGYELLIHPCNAASPGIIPEIMTMVESARVAGLILSPPLSEMPDVLQALDDKGICYVRVLSGEKAPDTSLPCVLINDYEAAFAITEHLITEGHRRIAFIAGEREHHSTIERQNGYLAALNKHGITQDPSLLIDGTYSFGTGVHSAESLLSLDLPPSAVFACNDEIAAGMLYGARMKGFDVPGDLAIAGFENSPFSRQTFPPLTTATQPTADIARSATSSLISSLKVRKRTGKLSPAEPVYFVPELLVRASTRRDA